MPAPFPLLIQPLRKYTIPSTVRSGLAADPELDVVATRGLL